MVLGYALCVVSAESLVLCQELDCSGLLGVSDTVALWFNESVVQGTMVQRRAQSSNWKEDEKDSGICQEVDEYKTAGKVQLLRDTYT